MNVCIGTCLVNGTELLAVGCYSDAGLERFGSGHGCWKVSQDLS